MQLRLDRSRDYGTIHGERGPGDPDYLAFFRQDGLRFDAQGIVMAPKTPEEQAIFDEKMKELAQPASGKPASKDTGGDVNFEMWLRGEIEYPPYKLQKALKARFGVSKQSNADIAEFLILDEKGPRLMAPDEVTPALRAKLAA